MSQQPSYLSEEQRQQLQELPFSVLLPSALPSAWKVSATEFSQDEEGISYSLTLCKEKASVSFLTTNEGIGDPPGGERTSCHSHPELGELSVEHEEDGDFLSDWVQVDEAWSAVSGREIADTELDQFIASLVIVKT